MSLLWRTARKMLQNCKMKTCNKICRIGHQSRCKDILQGIFKLLWLPWQPWRYFGLHGNHGDTRSYWWKQRMSPYIADKSVIVLYYFLVDNSLGRKWTLEQSVDVGRYYRIFSMILPDGEIISVWHVESRNFPSNKSMKDFVIESCSPSSAGEITVNGTFSGLW